MLVLVGSLAPAKVDAVRAAVDAIAAIDARFVRTIVEPIAVGEVAPPLPTSIEATLEGARARARTAFERGAGDSRVVGGDIIAIGIEAGVSPLPIHPASAVDEVNPVNPVEQTLVTWAAATDGHRWGYGAGGAITLPRSVSEAIAGQRDLGDIIDQLAGAPIRATGGAWGLLTSDLVNRRGVSETAVLAALAPFYNPSLFLPPLFS